MEATTVLYTYVTVNGQLDCNSYGYTDAPSATAEGKKLQAATPALGFMVLPLQAPPAA